MNLQRINGAVQSSITDYPIPTVIGIATAALGLWLGWRKVRRPGRRNSWRPRARDATTASRKIDWSRVFKVYITIVTAGLSVTGMTHVMSVTFGFPLLVAIIAATSVDGAAVDFGMEARKARVEGRPAWQRMVVVWALAILSGGLSAAASTSQHPALEGTVRFAMPMLAMLLNYSWMLPPRVAENLTQVEKGKRTWKLEKARRRLERGKKRSWALRWILVPMAVRLQERADDRLTQHAIVTGETTTDALMEHAEKGALRRLMEGFGAEHADASASEQRGLQGGSQSPLALPEQSGLQSTGQSTGQSGLQSTGQSTGQSELQSTGQSTSALPEGSGAGAPEPSRALTAAATSSGGSSGRQSSVRPVPAAGIPQQRAMPPDGAPTLSEQDVPKLSDEELRALESLLVETSGVVPSQGVLQSALKCGVSKSQRIQARLEELGFTPPLARAAR